MTLNFEVETADSETLFQGTEEMFRVVALELLGAARRVGAGEFGETKATVTAAKELRAAFQIMMEERNRVGKLRKQMDGLVGDNELDFAAARDEIGRRLACLRDAGHGG